MTKEQIMSELSDIADCKHFCKKTDICTYLGVSLNTVKKYIKDVGTVNRQLHRIDDVAEVIMKLTNAGVEENYELEENVEQRCDV